MREDVQVPDHIETPDKVGTERIGVLFVLHAVVLAVQEAIDVSADQLAAVADIVEAVAFYKGTGANTFFRPVVDAAGGELVVHGLPEELAGGLVKAHDDALVPLDGGVARLLVVGAHE